MKPYTVSAPARLDLGSIRRYLAPAPKPIQAKILSGLRAAFNQAVDFPLSGLQEPEYSSEAAGPVRSLFVYPYRIFYRAETHPIVIVAIIHGAQDIEALMRQRLG